MYNLKKVYSDICRGYSIGIWERKSIYIKHLTHHDQVEIDEFYDQALAAAIGRHIRTEKEQIKWLADKKLWTIKDDIQIKQHQGYIDNLIKTKNTLFIKAQIEPIQKSLEDAIVKQKVDLRRKDELLGLTAEKVAEQKMQFEYLRLAFYKDSGLSEKLFSVKDISRLSDEDANSVLSLYIDSISSMDNQSLRKISVSNYFTAPFYLGGDRADVFFGKSLCELSFIQVNLLTYGIYFKNILQAHQVPEEHRENPDRIEEFVTRKASADKALNKAGSGRVGIVGATQEDFDNLNLRNDIGEMHDMTSKGYREAKKAANDMGY